ncbi:MAG: FMN-binding protein [Clostridiales bacterium]|nr:FMN-binding protein [Clostridiales bacterium]
MWYVSAAAVFGVFKTVDTNTKEAIKGVTFQTMNAAGVSDGEYDGHYEISPVKVSVRVTVEDEKISDIDIMEHQNGLGGKAERIADSVIANQSLNVDAVTGATGSSKTILKAIENALQSGGK